MSASAPTAAWNVTQSVLQTFAVNEKINQLLLSNLAAGAWRAEPPRKIGRPVAGIFAHIHNVRVMWVKAAVKDPPIPESLDRLTCTQGEVAAALAESAQSCLRLIESALSAPGGKIRNFKPDAVHFVAYLISHEAHHRGQIAQLARQSGYPLSKKIAITMWEWSPLAKSL